MADTITTDRGTVYTSPRRVMGEGAPVGLTSCTRCGSALVLDSADVDGGVDVLLVHDEWHRAKGWDRP